MAYQTEWLTPRMEFWTTLKLQEPGFSRASRNMAARTPDSGRGEVDERDDHGGGDPQQILRTCAESLLTAVARLQEGERHRTQTSVAHSSTSPAGTSAIEEHRRLFGYQTPSSSRSGKRSGTLQRGQGPSKKMIVTTRSGDCRVFPVKNTWTKLFVCLSCTSDSEVPTASAKINLSFAGLGEKKVVFQKDGKASHVYEKLVSEFPPLAEGGGFEILRTTENSSKVLCTLPLPPGGYTVPYLKSVLGQARGFIRPLQKDLSLQEQRAFQVSFKKICAIIEIQYIIIWTGVFY